MYRVNRGETEIFLLIRDRLGGVREAIGSENLRWREQVRARQNVFRRLEIGYFRPVAYQNLRKSHANSWTTQRLTQIIRAYVVPELMDGRARFSGNGHHPDPEPARVRSFFGYPDISRIIDS